MHAVYATDKFGKKYEVKNTRFENSVEAVEKWYVYDDARREDRLLNEWVKFLEVRSTEDPKYAGSQVTALVLKDSATGKQYLESRRGAPGFMPRRDLPTEGHGNVAYMTECLSCAQVIGASGFGIGSHRRACKGGLRFDLEGNWIPPYPGWPHKEEVS